MSNTFTYPTEPMRPIERPSDEQIRDRAPLHENTLWFTHDPAIYHDPVSGDYFVYATEGKALRSSDLITWKQLGKVVPSPSDDAEAWTTSKAIWAPDIVKVGDEYRLYCSNSKFGSQRSAIFLAVSDKAQGPFEPKGIVVKTDETFPINAIDANIVEDVNTGRQYMTYGSFWGGIYILELDKETGFAKEEGIGTCLAKRPRHFDGAIEGPYIIYNPDTEYYYLFVSYGSLNNDYNIRVGRSKCITGPYLDHNGREMTDMNDDDCTLGYMVSCGYKFDDAKGWMGPGHNSVLHDVDGKWYLVNHIRPHNFKIGDISTMHIRQILWSEDGWPLASPEIYTGEQIQPVTEDMIPGVYEKITLAPTVPQGISTSVKLELFPGGKMSCFCIRGGWELIDPYTLKITYASHTELLKLIPVWDYENWKPTLAFTGINENHICIWGKKKFSFESPKA